MYLPWIRCVFEPNECKSNTQLTGLKLRDLSQVLNVTSVQPTLTPAEFDAAVTQQRQKMQELRASDNAYADNAPQPSADGAETTQGTPDVEMEDPMQL